MKKKLSLRFERSVSESSGRPDVLEIVLTPLNSASSPEGNYTLLSDKVVKKVRLGNETNIVTFDVTPTYEPGLTQPIFYRIGWRKGYMGRITEHDFSMPNRDVDFDDLTDLGQIIDGENYLQEEDLGVPGRVARLNNEGDVVNGDGVPIGAVQLDTVNAAIAQERRDRVSEDTRIQRDLTLRLETQVSSLSNTLTVRFNSEQLERTNAIAAEKAERVAADANLEQTLAFDRSSVATRFSGVDAKILENANALKSKADLVGGKLATSQIPSLALGDTVVVADEAAMLALTPAQVQRGDIAVRPDGSFRLSGDDISNPDNWIKLSGGGGAVTSVNGQVGLVVLNAQNVGARPADAAIPMADINGLAAALNARATTAALSTTNGVVAAHGNSLVSLDGRLTALDAKAAKVNAQGELSTSLLGNDIPRVDANNQFLRKDGSIIPIQGSGGGGTGNIISVNGKTGTVVLNAQDVAARPSGVPVPIADVDTLLAVLANKPSNENLQSTNTRVSRLEVKVADLEAGGGGTGGGGAPSSTTVSYTANENATSVTIRSPFGIGSNGTPYYDSEGAVEGEAAYPYVARNGHLELRKLDPNAPNDPAPVDLATFDLLKDRVGLLETGSAKPAGGWLQTDLESRVQTALEAVQEATPSSAGDSLVMRNSSGTFAVTEPQGTSHPATKGYTDTALALKAEKTTVSALTTVVNTKAQQGDLTALAGRVSNVEGTTATKADLDTNSTVPVAQIPTLPGSKITGFSSKADLDSATGKLLAAQIPSSIPQANVTNLVSTLAAKADLVGGKLPTSQLPTLATRETYPVANRAAMLALTTTQVQVGDDAIITGTADQGSYIYIGPDPTQFSSWLKLQSPPGSVQTVNGQSGTVVLGAGDVGARSASTAIPQADVVNLTADLAAKASVSYVDTSVAGRTTPAAVTSQISSQAQLKGSPDVVATVPMTLSGAQSIDGALRGAGTRALLTAQSSSAQNGYWIIAANAWSRPADAADGSTFMPGSLAVVKSGTAHANSIWQMTTTTSGVTGTNSQNWTKVLQGGPPVVYTGTNGVQIDGTTISAKVGTGLIADSSGIRLDPAAVVRKYEQVVPEGSTVVSIPHNLGTRAVSVQVYDVASGDLYLVGTTAVSTNAVTLEFAAAPAAGQFYVVIFG